MKAKSGPIKASVDGVLILDAPNAELHGRRVKFQTKGGEPNLGAWDDFNEYISWPVQVAKPGRYDVIVRGSSARTANQFVLEVGAQKLTAQIPKTASWSDWVEVKAGILEIKEPFNLRPAGEPSKWKAMNLVSVTLRPR